MKQRIQMGPGQVVFVLALLLIIAGGRCSSSAQQPTDLLTPPPPDSPHLNGPKLYGVRPGHPFLYRIPCTGKRPMRFSADRLPGTLKLDHRTGIISGSAPPHAGSYAVTLRASNGQGRDARPFLIEVGDGIGLTPQMGWNDWYTFYSHITDSDVRTAAAALISSGMADFGYQYVDIDDGWMRRPSSNDSTLKGPVRDAQGRILPNGRFPDMRSLTGYIHSLGLKAGIYSSPGPLTCGGFEGSYRHEANDAHSLADWGFDLLKYDWCSYSQIATGKTHDDFGKPYRTMGMLLHGLDRDVIFNTCQYGMGDVWKWGRRVGAQSWRTTNDVGLAPNASLPGFYEVGSANAALSQYAGPGGWNDPDYLLIGTVGDGRNSKVPARTTPLTHDEQYSYMSMWSLMASPLIFSGDMSKLDAFTLNVLCNSEVIDVDQDSLGKQGEVVRKTAEEFVLEKQLDDGSVAVGLFNLSDTERSISADWSELGLSGKQIVRDLWRQRDAGIFSGTFSSRVPSHGVSMIRLRMRKTI